MGSLFNINNVLITESSLYANTALEELTESTYKKSFMSMAYDYISESTAFYYDLNKNFYKTVLESYGDFYIINEAFEGFIDKVKEIIKKFLEFIKRVFNEFIARLNGMFRSETYLKKHLKELSKFNSDHEFEFSGYEFKHIRDDKPSITVYDLVMDTSHLLSDVNKVEFTADSSGLGDKIKSAYDHLKDDLNEDYYDKVRGALIDASGGVSASDFADELFAYFRDDSSDTSEFTVDASKVLEARTRFENYQDLRKGIEKTKKRIEREYEDTRKALEKVIHSSGGKIDLATSNRIAAASIGIYDASGDTDHPRDLDDEEKRADIKVKGKTSAAEVRSTIDLFIKAKVSQVQMLSTIHSQVFSAKLEAAKDEFNQNRTILYRALYKVLGKQRKIS